MVQAPADPELTSEERLALTVAVAQFNRRLYFECHETLEKVWTSLRGPSRDFFQGLIQVSVGFHHLGRGNRVGALKTFTRALVRFKPYPARYLGFDLAAERSRLQSVLSALSRQDAAVTAPPKGRPSLPSPWKWWPEWILPSA